MWHPLQPAYRGAMQRPAKPDAPGRCRAGRWGMGWFTTQDLAEYLAAAGDFMRSRPAENTVPLTVTEVLRVRGAGAFGDAAPLFGWWRDGEGAVQSAFLVTPPYPLLLSSPPAQSLAPLAELLARAETPLTGVNGEPAAAEDFAAAWGEQTGAKAKTSMRERLFRLGELVPPTPAPAATRAHHRPPVAICLWRGSPRSARRRAPVERTRLRRSTTLSPSPALPP